MYVNGNTVMTFISNSEMETERKRDRQERISALIVYADVEKCIIIEVLKPR